MTGCYFHFGQNIWRKLQAEGKTPEYIGSEEFASKVKQMMALAFVPEADVVEVFETLSSCEEFGDMDFLIDYFEDNYIGRQRRGRRGQPRFALGLWNQYLRVLNDLPRSNNSVEAWHNAFNGSVSIAHPTVARLARKLQQEQHATAILRVQRATGQPPAKKRKAYLRIDEALRTMVSRYSIGDSVSYLLNIARVINIDVI